MYVKCICQGLWGAALTFQEAILRHTASNFIKPSYFWPTFIPWLSVVIQMFYIVTVLFFINMLSKLHNLIMSETYAFQFLNLILWVNHILISLSTHSKANPEKSEFMFKAVCQHIKFILDNALIIGMWQLYLKYNLSSFFYCYNVKNTHLSLTLKLQPFSIDIIVYEYTGVKKFEQITRQFLVEDPWWMSPFISPRQREGRLGARKVTPPTIWIQSA